MCEQFFESEKFARPTNLSCIVPSQQPILALQATTLYTDSIDMYILCFMLRAILIVAQHLPVHRSAESYVLFFYNDPQRFAAYILLQPLEASTV